jgi:hypothetical protein
MPTAQATPDIEPVAHQHLDHTHRHVDRAGGNAAGE